MSNASTTTTTLLPSSGGAQSVLSPEDTFVVAFRVLIYVSGVLGNLLVIFVILFLSEFRKLTHWYVLQLAIADFLFLQTLPFKISEQIHGRWIYPVGMCRALQTILFFNYYASILFLMIMAIDRYLAVCHALSSRVQRLRSRAYSYFITALTWAIALAMCIPVMMYSDTVGIKPTCFCTLQFPIDRDEWCHKHMQNLTQECYEDVFDDVHGESCMTNKPVTSGSGSGYDWFELGSGDLFSGLTSDIDFGSTGTVPFDEILPEPSTSGANETFFRNGCIYDTERKGWFVFIYFNFVVMFLLPLLVISLCYTLIVVRLMKTNVTDGGRRSSNTESTRSGGKDSTKKIWRTNRRKSSSASTGRTYREKVRVTVMCAVLVLLFILCWLPFHSVHLAKIEGITIQDDNICSRLAIATSLLAYLNSAFNPYLYNFLGTFQKRMKQIKNHKRMQSFLSATGLTRLGGGRSNSIVTSSDGSKTKHRSGSVPYVSEARGSVQKERIPLRTMDSSGNL
ncbi:somatostatin receptor type 5-like [Styela clava]